MYGIPIGLHYTWFFVFLGITWILAKDIFPEQYEGWSAAQYWGVAFVTSVLFFSSVLAHELGHSVVAIRYGIGVKSITLFVFGGVAQIVREAPRPMVEAMIAIAGPLVSVALGGGFLGLYFLLREFSDYAAASARYLGEINIMLAIFNMVPGFPLDGGRVFRAVLWGVNKDYVRSTRIAARIGQGIGYLFMGGGLAVGLWTQEAVNGLWLAIIGWFLVNIAAQSAQQVLLRERLKGVRVADIMTGGTAMIPAQMDLRTLVDRYLSLTDRHCFLVSDGDRWVGLVSVSDVKRVPRSKWVKTRVEDIMVPISRVHVVQPWEDALRAMEVMEEREVSHVPVVQDGSVVGVLGRDRVLQLLRNRG